MNIKCEFKQDHLADLATDGRITLKWTFKETEYECNNWNHLAQDTDYWWAVFTMFTHSDIS
jgi:hypothetical protein